MAGIKIVDLPALGRDLAATDLLELSLSGGTGSRKITGQEIINASKLNVGITPIINGTAGRLLFQGSGDVLQQSSSLFWDATNNRLGIGTSTPLSTLDINLGAGSLSNSVSIRNSSSTGYSAITLFDNRNSNSFVGQWGLYGTSHPTLPSGMYYYNTAGGNIGFFTGSGTPSADIRMMLTASGNTLIGTTTDAGFKLDVNGNSRVVNTLQVGGGATAGRIELSRAGTSNAGYIYMSSNNMVIENASQGLLFNAIGAERMRIAPTTGNVLINTTTDDGFKLDVNGTARVQGLTTIRTSASSYNNPLVVENTGSAGVDNKNVAAFIGNRGNATNIDDNTNIGIQQKSSIVNNYATVNFFNAGFNIAAYVGAQFLSHGTAQSGNLVFGTVASGTPATRMTIFSTGNLGVNTTTDAGFKLDVNGTARFTGRIDAGTFTPGAAAALYTIATTGRINAAGGIYFRNPSVGDTALTGFNSSNNDAQINVVANSTNVFYFSGAGGSTAPIAVATPNFNPSSGTGNKSIFEVNGVYNTTGTFTGTIRGFYYNPNLVSMTGVTAHWAFHSTSGRVRFEGLPTSPTGLNAGDIYNDGGTLKIV